MKDFTDYHNQRLELLLFYQKFLADIEKFRQYWGISPSSLEKQRAKLIKKTGFKSIYNGYEFYENSIVEKYGGNNDFKDLVIKSKLSDKSELGKLGYFFGLPTPQTQYRKAILSLLKKYKLSSRYEKSIRHFLYLNEFLPVSSVLIGSGSRQLVSKVDFLNFTIFTDFTRDDFNALWPVINKWQEQYKKEGVKERGTPLRNYSLQKRIWALLNAPERITVAQIVEEIKADSPGNPKQITSYGYVNSCKARIENFVLGNNVTHKTRL